jgi:hypothetical protein
VKFKLCNEGNKMAIESLVALALATAFLVGLAFYATKHRSEEDHKDHNHDQA